MSKEIKLNPDFRNLLNTLQVPIRNRSNDNNLSPEDVARRIQAMKASDAEVETRVATEIKAGQAATTAPVEDPLPDDDLASQVDFESPTSAWPRLQQELEQLKPSIEGDRKLQESYQYVVALLGDQEFFDEDDAEEATKALAELKNQIELKEKERHVEAENPVAEKIASQLATMKLTGLADTVAAQFQAELEACATVVDATQRDTQLKALQEKVRDHVFAIAVGSNITNLIPLDFPRQKQLRAKLDKALSSTELKSLTQELEAELETLRQEGAKKTSEAISAVTALKEETLAGLTASERIELLTKLRASDDPALNPQRQKAMARLYKAMKLEPQFAEVDQYRRDAVLEGLKSNKVLKEARPAWAQLGSEEKVKVLKEALKVQCGVMGIPENEMPPLLRFSDPAAKLSEDKRLTLAGGFNDKDGKIYLNDNKDSAFHKDFDDCLDTIIHENTHHFQIRMVKALEEGRLDPGHRDYNQAVLFKLNTLPGGYLGSGEGYEEQPTEQHAHEAGREAHLIFLKDESQAEAQILIATMQSWAQKFPLYKQKVDAYCQELGKFADSKDLKELTKLREFVRHIQASFDALADAFATELKDAQTEAETLIRKLEQWGQDHTDQATQTSQLSGFVKTALTSNNPVQIKRVVLDNEKTFAELNMGKPKPETPTDPQAQADALIEEIKRVRDDVPEGKYRRNLVTLIETFPFTWGRAKNKSQKIRAVEELQREFAVQKQKREKGDLEDD